MGARAGVLACVARMHASVWGCALAHMHLVYVGCPQVRITAAAKEKAQHVNLSDQAMRPAEATAFRCSKQT